MFRRFFKRIRKRFSRNNKVQPMTCTETESSSSDVATPQEFSQTEDVTQGKDFFIEEWKIEDPIETSVQEPTDEETEDPIESLNEELSDEDEVQHVFETPFEEPEDNLFMDIQKGPNVTYILVKEAMEHLDTLTYPDSESPESACPAVILRQDEENVDADSETQDTNLYTEKSERLSLLSLLNWSDEEEIADQDKEDDKLSLLSLLSWPSEEEISNSDIEADRLSLLSLLSWPSEEEIANSDKEADRLSLLSLLSWPSEEDIANSDIEADRLSLLSLLSWPSEEEMSDLDKEADRISLLSLLSWPSESSEEIISSGSSDMEPPMMISVTVRPKLTLAEETENQPDSSDQVHSAPRSYNLEESDHYKSQEEDSQDGNLPSGLDIGGIEIPRLDFQFETSSDSSERAYCLEAALPVIAQFRNTPEYQSKSRTPTISECTSEDFSNHSLLGEGKFGTVLLADHKYTKKKFAIKEIPKRTLDRETVQKIKTEMEIMQLVKTENAPFLVGSLASFETEYDQCLVMEYATGGDLESLMKKYDLPLKCSVFYSACIVLGLKFLHEHKIVHRDLKPENILLDSKGYPRIADYGISKTGIGFRQLMYNECGTLPYMAPELFTEPYYTRSVDWWALGVIIYRMILGKLPFAGRNPDEIRMNIIRERPKYPLTLPAHVRNILQGLLTKNPALRLGSTIEGAQAVMDQPFFYGMDWEALRRKQIKPVFIIPSTGTATD